jgi:hypothetical protein
METRFRRISEWPSAIVAGQGQRRYEFWALSTRRLDGGFWTRHERSGVWRIRIRPHFMEIEGIYGRFDILVHWASLFFPCHGVLRPIPVLILGV